MSVRDRVVIVPETDKPYQYLNGADIAVCCSRMESYPRVTLEAMAFGLPLITTPVFGISEQVRSEVNALLYNPDDVSELARHLSRLILDQELRAKLSTNGPLMLAALPSFEEMLDSYGRLFREARLSGGNPDIDFANAMGQKQTPCAA
jgi:glycosyltransferase involved in cell wall biosynthesis